MVEHEIHFYGSSKWFHDQVKRHSQRCMKMLANYLCIFSGLRLHISDNALITPVKYAILLKLKLWQLIRPPREVFASRTYKNIFANHIIPFASCTLIFIANGMTIWELYTDIILLQQCYRITIVAFSLTFICIKDIPLSIRTCLQRLWPNNCPLLVRQIHSLMFFRVISPAYLSELIHQHW